MKNTIRIAVLFLGFVACNRTPLGVNSVHEAGPSDPTPSAPVATATETQTQSAASVSTETATNTDTATGSQTATASTTVTATATETVTAVFEVTSVEVIKSDDFGNNTEKCREFIVYFSSPAKDFDLTISSNEDGVFLHEYREHTAGGMSYIGPFNWSRFLKSDTTYQWTLTANAAGPVIGNASVSVSSEFTTVYCFIGEYKYFYTDAVRGTDNVGRCHGAMMECVDNGHGNGMLSGAGEVTPYPWGDIPGNGIDDDCNGIVDDGGADFCPVGDSKISQGCCVTGGATFEHSAASLLKPGDLFRGVSFEMVYYLASDGKRYVFPSKDTLVSWYSTGQDLLDGKSDVCNRVKLISDVDLAGTIIGGNVSIRPGTYLVKIDSDPVVYAISRNRTLHAIGWQGPTDYPIEGQYAEMIFPGTSLQRLRIIPDAFFTNYWMGITYQRYNGLEVPADTYDPAAEYDYAAPNTMEAELGIN